MYLLSEHICPPPPLWQVENPWMLTLFHSLIYLKYLLRLIMWQALDKHWGFSVETHSLGQRGKHTQITVIQCGKCYNIALWAQTALETQEGAYEIIYLLFQCLNMNVSVNTFSLEMLAALWFFTSIILFDASNNPFKKLLFHQLTSPQSRDPSGSYGKKEYVSGGNRCYSLRFAIR